MVLDNRLLQKARRPRRLLPLRRVPDGTASRQQSPQPPDSKAPIRQAIAELGRDLDQVIEQEREPGLGNGGLGRLAACYLDSMATLGVPAIGYGIRYEFGIFHQEIQDGWQVELTDYWLRYGNPWEIRRPQAKRSTSATAATPNPGPTPAANTRCAGSPTTVVKGIPYDTPILGYRSGIANDLRLWRSEATESFYFERFNSGDYQGAVAGKVFAENISKVLYPNDEEIQGKELRLQQQYFFTSCSLQDMIRLPPLRSATPSRPFIEKWAIQLNDTHPSIGVAELMRLLIDEHGLGWDKAWEITSHTFSYTNHTLLPEALERWPLPMFGSLLPAPSRDHLRDQRALPRSRAPALSRRRGTNRPHVAHRRARREVRPHGLSRLCRQPARQRRRRAAHRLC